MVLFGDPQPVTKPATQIETARMWCPAEGFAAYIVERGRRARGLGRGENPTHSHSKTPNLQVADELGDWAEVKTLWKFHTKSPKPPSPKLCAVDRRRRNQRPALSPKP
jgi:hypothetical protein